MWYNPVLLSESMLWSCILTHLIESPDHLMFMYLTCERDVEFLEGKPHTGTGRASKPHMEPCDPGEWSWRIICAFTTGWRQTLTRVVFKAAFITSFTSCPIRALCSSPSVTLCQYRGKPFSLPSKGSDEKLCVHTQVSFHYRRKRVPFPFVVVCNIKWCVNQSICIKGC